ncbi:hypothetical protein [Candidatus Laterigemmans baculatus]|uniref:hypothetical protein n=1 Tax=Candidatus Laterigemmans baculatus TaxID=2770505 RepID=UPI0013DA5A84|nr:hypothetical protein [Candidatus Laterigemmans baculatus]
MSGTQEGVLQDGWERFWFTPESLASLRFVRIGLGVLAACYFATHWADVGYWFGSEGLLSTEQLSRLSQSSEVAGAGRWHLTPLYWIESTLGLRVVLGFGIAASLLLAAGIGGWGVAALTWLILLAVVARAWVIAGLAEVPLVVGLFGLAIAASGVGVRQRWEGRRWSGGGFARRLLEIHIAAIVGFTALTQLAAETWWNGEGALQLVLPQDGPTLELASLGNSQLLTAALTHLIVWLPIVAVPLLWLPGRGTANPPRLRRIAAGALIAHALVLGVLSGHLLYEAANAVLLSLFLLPRGAGGLEHGE